MKNCERCNELHDGTYGSGRFCSLKCAQSRTYSEEVKEKLSKSVSRAQTGKSLSEETKKKIALKEKGQKFSLYIRS